MEQKMIEKVNKAIDMYNAKATKFNKDAARLLEEMFPDDIRNMVKELCSNMNSSYYSERRIEFRFNDAVPFHICEKCDMHPFNGPLYLGLIEKQQNYSDKIISSINTSIYDYEQSVCALDSIQSHVEEVISQITEMYEEKINKQNDELDKIFQKLSGDEPEIKHIKVTVEWV